MKIRYYDRNVLLMKKTILVFTSLIFVSLTFGQGYDPEKINKKAVTVYNQALEKAQGRDYKAAVNLLLCPGDR